MDVFAKYVSGIDNPDHRLRMEEILSWTAGQFPSLKPQIKWNTPMFTDHGTFIIGFAAAKHHVSVSPEEAGIAHFADDIARAGYSATSRLFRIQWTDPVHYDLLESMIQFNIQEKADCSAFLLEDAEIKETISPYFMARIVDIEQFINQYPFKPQKEKRTWSFTLEDPLLEWNQGVFTAEISPEGKAVLSRGGDADAAKLDIQTMTALLFAYRKPEYLHRTGRIECTPDTLEFIEDLLETQTPYFSDYF